MVDRSGPLGVRSAGHLVATVVLYTAAGVVGGLGWPFRIVAVVFMGFLVAGLGGAIHESVHRLLFAGRRANEVVGRVVAALLLMPYDAYRAYHIDHHRWTLTERDPEGPEGYRFTRRSQFLFIPLAMLGFVASLARVSAQWARGRGPAWSAAPKGPGALLSWIGALGPLVAGWVVSPAWMVRWWLVPWTAAVILFLPWWLLTEHYGAATGSGWASTVTSNRLVSWAYWWNNLHDIHHRDQRIPPQHRLAAHIATLGPPPAEGYLKRLSAILRTT